MVFAGSTLFAQTPDLRVGKLGSNLDVVLDVSKNESFYFAYPQTIYDTVSTTWDLVFGLDKVVDFTKLYTKFTLDSISGTPIVTVKTYGKLFWTDEWTPIDTVEWAGTTADTTFRADNATATAYRFYKAEAVADTAGNFRWKVNTFEFKIFK